MTLQVIKAEDVRDGEPRWWCTDDGYAAQTLTWIDATYLHAEPRSGTTAACHIAIVDRPAPTPTAPPALDLDAVEAAERAMTAGPWRYRQSPRWLTDSIKAHDVSSPTLTPVARDMTPDDANGVCELRNSAPALIAEVRALRAQVCRLVSGQAIESDHLCQHHDADLAALAEVATLRGKLAEATSLLRSAGDLFVEIQATDGEDEHKAITDGAKLSAVIAAALEAL